jgi:NOL1/NOP2/fmu family ribosome biogenesis protein
MKVLEKEEVENLERMIEKNYGTRVGLNQFLVLLSSEEKIWLASKEIMNLDMRKFPVNSIGMNFGKIKRNDKVNLTIEGSQMVGKLATKNVVALDEQEAQKFMQGSDVKPQQEINCEYHNFAIVKSGEDVLGSSPLTEEGLQNLLPKSRRVPI